MSKRKNEKLYNYLLLFLVLYGVTLFIWPMALFGLGMSLSAPYPHTYDTSRDLLVKILFTYPLGVLFAIFYCGISYESGRYKAPYWVVHVPLLWPVSWMIVEYLGLKFSF